MSKTNTPVEQWFCCKRCQEHKSSNLFHKNPRRKNGLNRWCANCVNEVSSIHSWIGSRYGNPKKCEGEDCRGVSQIFEWCLIGGMEYERNRDNFIRLCRSCHRRYDLDTKKQKLATENLWWKRGISNPGSPIKKGDKLSEEHKDKISKYAKTRARKGNRFI